DRTIGDTGIRGRTIQVVRHRSSLISQRNLSLSPTCPYGIYLINMQIDKLPHTKLCILLLQVKFLAPECKNSTQLPPI
ncbi:phytanoyl-dioxygenase family protein, partial [Moniliophthora roreri]